MPMKNFRVCQRIDPTHCSDYKTERREHSSGKPVQFLYATDDRTGQRVVQSIRFPISHWTSREARRLCRHRFIDVEGSGSV